MDAYLFLFRLPAGFSARPSEEAVRARQAWFGALAAEGRIVDRGQTLSPHPGVILQADGSELPAGAEAGQPWVSGYVVVKAEGWDQARALARTNPVFEVGGSVEVRSLATFLTGAPPSEKS